MIVDFVEQFVDETDEFLRLAVQNVVGGGVDDQILWKTALGFHFFNFRLESCDPFDKFLFLELD